MPEHPLLVFPEPARAGRKRRPSGGGGKLTLPNARSQVGRLEPQFQRLQQAMEQRRLALQDDALGIQPELVLVFETVGPIENFIKAVKKIDGMEWLAEVELDDLAPDYGFADEKHPDKSLKGQLYLVMTDQRAMEELQRLFRNWKSNPDMKFPRGLAPWKDAFVHLYDIRRWGAEDRIRETHVLEDWSARVAEGQEVVPFEAELWFRRDPARRRQSDALLRDAIHSAGGQMLQSCVIEEIGYHGVLGEIPIERVRDISDYRDVRLLQCEDIMYLRPVGQCAVYAPEDVEEPKPFEPRQPFPVPEGEPVVALFDGLPLAGHELLDGRLQIDDPDGYENHYQVRERRHGTAMASLICRGDLDLTTEPLRKPIYVRPILRPSPGPDGIFPENIPEGVLPVDLVNRAVRRLYESEDGEPPAAPHVRIINLSVCDRFRPFARAMSAFARLLDWLAWNYNVLFVVSAGNHPQAITVEQPRESFNDLNAARREAAIIRSLAADTRNRRLLSPAETVNGLTVGATHDDGSTAHPTAHLVEPYTNRGLPSPISAHGPGYRRSIKPDLFMPGGRQWFRLRIGGAQDSVALQILENTGPPGQQVTAPGRAGELNRTNYTRGTSNAAALATRSAAQILEMLNVHRTDHGAQLPLAWDAVLLKALLVHGAAWSDAGDLYRAMLRNDQNGRTVTDYVGRFLGYGSADVARATVCTDQRVTVLGVGELGDEGADVFSLPLPPDLSASVEKRRLTITLAWLTPVNSQRQSYRVAHLWFDPENDLAPKRMCADFRAVQRGTVQHEVLEGDQAVPYQDGQSIEIKVNCRADAGYITEPIRYALAVTLEVAEGIDIRIYQQVRDRLRLRVPVAGRSR